jgi:hypothetical protein
VYIINPTHIQGAGSYLFGRHGRQADGRQILAFADTFKGFLAVHVGQHNVKNDQIWNFIFNAYDSILSIISNGQLITNFLEKL